MPPTFDFIFLKSPLPAGILQLRGALLLLELPLMIKAIGLCSVVITMLCPVAGVSAETGNDRVKVSMLADVSGIQPGKSFWVGFNFVIKPGFHIYWKNPGDSGLATEIKLELPDGFKAGDVMFPVPECLKLPGDIINYAYENKVMLLARITPPSNLETGSSVTVSAKINWLVCKDDCLPGSETVSINLPVADAASPVNEALFNSWRSRLPTGQDRVDVDSCVTGIAVQKTDAHCTIKIIWKLTPNEIQYLPGPLKIGDTDDVKIVSSGSATTILFNIKNYSPGEAVAGLVSFTTSTGNKMGLDVSIPAK